MAWDQVVHTSTYMSRQSSNFGLFLCVQLPGGRGIGSSTMPISRDSYSTLDRYYCHISDHAYLYMYTVLSIRITNLKPHIVCSFTCAFLERRERRETNFGNGVGGNLQVIFLGRKLCFSCQEIRVECTEVVTL